MSIFERPGGLDRAIANWLQKQVGADLRENAERLSKAYKHGKSSAHINLAAYLTARMPATYAAVARVLEEVVLIAPEFSPRTMLDVGAGPGTASWAALAAWPDIADIKMVETDARFVGLASALAHDSDLPSLVGATIAQSSMNTDTSKAELIIAAYVFAELEEQQAMAAAAKLWQQCEHTLIIIEPGTPRGFARIKKARAVLLEMGANIIGPCTHTNTCPMAAGDWCHFTQRLARSREHMHAKTASVPFEDEPFSWIAVSKFKHELPQARIIARPVTTKIATILKLCDEHGLTTQTIASRDRQRYKQSKKLEWGNAISAKS